LKRRFKYRCVRCGAFEGSLWAPALSPDHVVPLSRGGTNTIENIQPLCPPCNRWKRDKSIDFRNWRPYMEKVWMLCRMRHSIQHVECRTMPDEAIKSPSIGRFASSCSA
jgi:5-methylcytosine-specific restriction endonuclease McrA